MEIALWDVVSWGAFAVIIAGVLWEKYGIALITFGALILALYAWFSLGNLLFAVLQSLIVVSGISALLKVKKFDAVLLLTILTVCAYIFLFWYGAITDIFAFIGSLGLLCIVFALVAYPKLYSFVVMAVGGLLLCVYAFSVDAYVFFFLNSVFFFLNIRGWLKSRAFAKDIERYLED